MGVPTKNGIILVVIVTGSRVDPIYIKDYSTENWHIEKWLKLADQFLSFEKIQNVTLFQVFHSCFFLVGGEGNR